VTRQLIDADAIDAGTADVIVVDNDSLQTPHSPDFAAHRAFPSSNLIAIKASRGPRTKVAVWPEANGFFYSTRTPPFRKVFSISSKPCAEHSMRKSRVRA
jgi:hypothetical protein